MKYEFDLPERSVSLTAPKSVYSRDGLGIAAHIFAGRAEVYLSESPKSWELTLKSRRPAGEAELRALAGEFFNELLNQEYRFLVSRLNAKVSGLIVAQTLLSARGGETAPAAPPEERTPEFKAEVDRMMAEAAEEIRRTMPRRIAPQGNPLPPSSEESLA
jgi:His-Xaa-Ser system protein HxsD